MNAINVNPTTAYVLKSTINQLIVENKISLNESQLNDFAKIVVHYTRLTNNNFDAFLVKACFELGVFYVSEDDLYPDTFELENMIKRTLQLYNYKINCIPA